MVLWQKTTTPEHRKKHSSTLQPPVTSHYRRLDVNATNKHPHVLFQTSFLNLASRLVVLRKNHLFITYSQTKTFKCIRFLWHCFGQMTVNLIQEHKF